MNGNTIQSNSAATITSTTPANDVAYGGGVYVSNAPVNLTANTIMSNTANAKFAFGFGGAFGYGGGIYITNSPVFTLTSNSILTNTASYKYYRYPSGGGIEIEFSRGTLSGNVIQGNYANGNILFGNGGGLAVLTSTVTIQGGQILNNKTAINCEGYGGGLYAFNSPVTLDAVLLQNDCAGNTPFYGLGGGLAFFKSPYTMTNALVVKNFAYPNQNSAVGGLHADATSPGLVVNNTFADNKAVSIHAAAALTATNNIIVNSRIGISATGAISNVTFSDFYNHSVVNAQGFPLGVTNIVINPQLDANYHLNPGSPAIDAGTSTNAPNHDYDGQPRPMKGTSGQLKVDIGADEFGLFLYLPLITR